MIVETVRPVERGKRFQLRCMSNVECMGPVCPEADNLPLARQYAQTHADKWRHLVEIDDTEIAVETHGPECPECGYHAQHAQRCSRS